MDLNKNQNNKFISLWLLLITFLVALIIIVGGLTRLTDSGLSITKWDLFTGIFPPISLDDWEKSFSLYKKIPEYKLINSSMTLDQFKIIYWWEYAHRLLGRAIVLLFILPLIYLTFKRKLSKKNIFSFANNFSDYFDFTNFIRGVCFWLGCWSNISKLATDESELFSRRFNVY
jgi:cytochrome c oxidase assembly protein subunit 15